MNASLESLLRDRGTLEDYSMQQARSAYCGRGITLSRVLARYLLYAQGSDISIASHLMIEGFWESWVTIALGRMIQPEWICVDVGANVGYYTVLMADLVGKGGTVYSAEPNPEIFDLLTRNVEVNGMSDRCQLEQRAMGKEPKNNLFLEYPNHMPGSGSVARTPDRVNLVRKPVVMSTLDGIIPDGQVDLIKIDAEGSDYDVILGAGKILERSPNCVVMFEHVDTFYDDPKAKLKEATAGGMSLYFVDYDGSIKPIAADVVSSQPERLWNLVLRR